MSLIQPLLERKAHAQGQHEIIKQRCLQIAEGIGEVSLSSETAEIPKPHSRGKVLEILKASGRQGIVLNDIAACMELDSAEVFRDHVTPLIEDGTVELTDLRHYRLV